MSPIHIISSTIKINEQPQVVKKYPEMPKIYRDCRWIISMARYLKIYPLDYDTKKEFMGQCPLSFSWTSLQSFQAYFMFALITFTGIIEVATSLSLSVTVVDYFGSFTRGFCDVFLILLLLLASMNNTPKVIRSYKKVTFE
jgi:hypothetical protein